MVRSKPITASPVNIICLIVITLSGIFHSIYTPCIWSAESLREMRESLECCYASFERILAPSRIVKSTVLHAPPLVSAQESFSRGNALYEIGDVDGALQQYEHSIAIDSTFGPALTNIGNVYLHKKNYDMAREFHIRALRYRAESGVAHYNLGVAYHQLGQLQDAIASYEAALRLEPNHIKSSYNLALALQDDNQLQRAVMEYQRLIAKAPGHADSRLNLCNCFMALHHPFSQVEACFLGLVNDSSSLLQPRALVNLASLYHSHSRNAGDADLTAKAVLYYQKALEIDPKNTMALHGLAATSSATQVKEMPTQYVMELFDSYAFHFDSSLEKLEYKAHVLVAEAAVVTFKKQGGKEETRVEVLDLGCGTGLACPPLRQHGDSGSWQITGLDLSEKMVNNARSRQCYDSLVVSDIDTWLTTAAETTFDIVVAADVFCYIGDLSNILEKTRKIMKVGGVFSFTVESLISENCDYSLQFSGRIAHTPCYVERILAKQQACLTSTVVPVVPRADRGKDVQGLLVTLVRTC